MTIKYVGQSGTSGYASAAKGYIVDYVIKNININWHPLVFDNSKNDDTYIIDLIAQSAAYKNYEKYSKLIIHSTPNIWNEYIKHYDEIPEKIGYCTWETTKLPSDWVKCINQVSEVWVPSNFNKEVFINSGVKSNITVVPHVKFEEKLYDKNQIKLTCDFGNHIPNNKFTYYCIGEFNERKGISDIIKVFEKINDKYPDTQLILKLHFKLYNEQTNTYIKNSLTKLSKKLNKSIFILIKNLKRSELLAIHSFGDCYVSLHKGEGFGLTIFDAFNLNKEIITTNFGGQIDYLGKNYKGLVDYKLCNVSNMENFNSYYSNDQEWAQPDLDHAYTLMENAYLNKKTISD